jgi:hypothetical protein
VERIGRLRSAAVQTRGEQRDGYLVGAVGLLLAEPLDLLLELSDLLLDVHGASRCPSVDPRARVLPGSWRGTGRIFQGGAARMRSESLCRG